MKASALSVTFAMISVAGFLFFTDGAVAQASEPADQIKECEAQLRERFAVRHTVTWPTNQFVFSCDSGGPGDCSADFNLHFGKAVFVNAGGLGDPNQQTIESARLAVGEQSGGAALNFSNDSESVTASGGVSKGWFGGGQTVRFQFVVVLRATMGDETASTIGRICAAKVFGPGEPQ